MTYQTYDYETNEIIHRFEEFQKKLHNIETGNFPGARMIKDGPPNDDEIIKQVKEFEEYYNIRYADNKIDDNDEITNHLRKLGL